MQYYKVTVSIIKNSELPFFETHYATGNGNPESAILSVKNMVSKAYHKEFPEDIWVVLLKQGGAVEISEVEYNSVFKQ